MIYRPGIKLSNLKLTALALVSLFFLFIQYFSVSRRPLPEQKLMLRAAGRMIRAEKVIFAYRQRNNILVNTETDPLNSGFIGKEFSPITTTLGNIEAKQTATNPDFAALFVRWFGKLALKKGDKIIIHSSGSFPALCISAIIAAETFGLESLIFSSLGASSFGANLPEFTYWDMENILLKQSLIHHHTLFATPGGQHDNGSSFWEGGMEIARQAAARNNLRLRVAANLEEAIANKLSAIRAFRFVKLFINIGGNQAAVGSYPCSMQIPVGLIRQHLSCQSKQAGLIYRLNQEGLPLIHMLQIKDIALANGISLIPHKTKKSGLSDLYYKKESPVLLNALLVFLMAGIWLFIFLKQRRNL